MYDDEYTDMIPEDYRMGYHSDRRIREEMPMEHKGSRRGETYDRYRDNRRHYTDTRDAESKKKMDESMKEYMDDAMDSMKEMWKDADPQLKQTMKTELTKLVQQLQ